MLNVALQLARGQFLSAIIPGYPLTPTNWRGEVLSFSLDAAAWQEVNIWQAAASYCQSYTHIGAVAGWKLNSNENQFLENSFAWQLKENSLLSINGEILSNFYDLCGRVLRSLNRNVLAHSAANAKHQTQMWSKLGFPLKQWQIHQTARQPGVYAICGLESESASKNVHVEMTLQALSLSLSPQHFSSRSLSHIFSLALSLFEPS